MVQQTGKTASQQVIELSEAINVWICSVCKVKKSPLNKQKSVIEMDNLSKQGSICCL